MILTSAINQGQNTQELVKAVNTASESTQAAWIVLLGLTAYYIVALGGINDHDLLINAPITLPLLGISINLNRFFLFAPLIYMFLHLGVLVHHVGLVRKAYALLAIIENKEIAETATTGKPYTHPLRYQISGNFMTQFIVGSPENVMIRFFQQAMVWGTLVLLPLVVMLSFLIAFLPFHDLSASWLHRIYILITLLVTGLIGVFLPTPERHFWRALGAGLVKYPTFYLLTMLGFTAVAFMAFFVATIPNEWLDRVLSKPAMSVTVEDTVEDKTRLIFTPTAYLFEGALDPATGRLASLFHRNLVVTDEDVGGKDVQNGHATVSLRYRDLRYGRFDRSSLHGVDLTCADLRGAVLTATNMTDAKTGCPVN